MVYIVVFRKQELLSFLVQGASVTHCQLTTATGQLTRYLLTSNVSQTGFEQETAHNKSCTHAAHECGLAATPA